MKVIDQINGWIGRPLGEVVGPWVTAILIIIVGYIIAKLIASGIRKALNHTNLDDKMANVLGQDADGCEKGISTFVFWLLMLFVIIFALSAAGRSDVVQPLQDVLDSILGILPNILAAAAIGFVAWVIATVVKNLLTGLLSASRVDERLGLGESKPITNSVGLVAFFGIILMLLPAILGALEMDEISEPISSMVDQIFAYIPDLIAGLIIFAVGYLIASIVQKVLSSVLSSIGVDALPSRLGYRGDHIFGKPLSTVISYVAMATILVVMGAQAIQTMNLGFISELATDFVPGYFKILAAIIIFGVAFFVANIIGQLIEPKSHFWARITRIAIIVFLGATALQMADISDLTNDTFQLIINCAVIAAAFAIGVGGAIAIGLGGREKASSWLSRLK